MMDVQGQADSRNLPIQKVGVKNLKYPVVVLDKTNKIQHTTAEVNMYADLPHHFKGTHMSRFIDVFNQYYKEIAMPRFLDMLESIRENLEARAAYAEVKFPYFIEKAAPVSGLRSMMSYRCSYIGEVNASHRSFYVGIEVPVTTVCPCSKEISSRGAHNQRGTVRVQLKLGPNFWIEDVIQLVEESASADLYTLLKREDEKYITERAYDNPRFVEDLVRDTAVRIGELKHFPWFSVEAENYESIHNHSAFARLEQGRR